MKRRKILVSILISILLLIVGAVPAFAATIPEDQLGWKSYNAEDGTKYVVITECICEDPVWEFPAEIDGKPVLKIYGHLPRQQLLKSLSISSRDDARSLIKPSFSHNCLVSSVE